MITTVYFLLFILSVGYLFLLLSRFRQNISVYYVLMSVCVILINYGYWQSSLAATLEEALSACRISYLGSAFVGYVIFRCIAELTKTTVPAVLQYIWVGLDTVILLLAMTIGRSDLYYKSVRLMQKDGFSYLVKEYSPLHLLFVVQIILTIVGGLLIVAISFTRQ